MFGQGVTSVLFTALLGVSQVAAGPIARSPPVYHPASSYKLANRQVEFGPQPNFTCGLHSTTLESRDENGVFEGHVKIPTTDRLGKRSPGCQPTIIFSCNGFEEACAGMCFNRFCRPSSRAGVFPSPLHRGKTNSGIARRKSGGFKSPSRTNSPCRVGGQFNFNAGFTSMDEFPFAVSIEGGLQGTHGPGFRCINNRENSQAGSRIQSLLNKAKVDATSNSPTAANAFNIHFIDTTGVQQDWCDVNSQDQPVTQCQNDGNMFESTTSNGKAFTYDELPSGENQALYARNRNAPTISNQ